jgi:hypothetical protein
LYHQKDNGTANESKNQPNKIMLLRITQISGGNTDLHPHPSPTMLHACLATSSSSTFSTSTQATNSSSITPDYEHGELFTVGRKNCTVTLDDKCVSRRHGSVRLLTDRYFDAIGNTGGVEFGRPETQEERDACASSRMGVICVLRDCGSKFGTFVSVDEELAEKFTTHNNKTAEKDDTGDETDDDGGLTTSNYADLTDKQIKAVKLLNTHSTTVPKFQRLELQSTTILLPLSHSINQHSNPHVTILFGPQGSGIQLTLIPLQFTFSRLSSKDQDLFLSRLPTIGAVHSPQWNAQSTHLITKESKATAKHIMAWACCKPTVTQDYVLALLTRSHCYDPMPKEADYTPPGTSQLNDPLSSPCRALRGYKIAVMLEDDSAPLAESAGARVLSIYEQGPEDNDAFETWWEDQCRRAADDKLALVVMETTSKKATGWMK